MTIAAGPAREAGEDFIRDVVRADILAMGCPA
jgi:hypothetical protein